MIFIIYSSLLSLLGLLSVLGLSAHGRRKVTSDILNLRNKGFS